MTPQGRIWVFAGPSLPPVVRPRSDAFLWRSPAIAGDFLEILDERPRAVVLIDGLFDAYPAVRHKEILALMERGAPVFGAASMGALRAAELHMYGMRGVGRIFEAYARGRLVGDDEVAVLHAPAELDWAPLTIPMVNIRASLVRAVRQGVIGPETARRLRRRAGEIFFKDRTLLALRAAAGEGSDPGADRFLAWLSDGYVDLKQADALACLAAAEALTPGLAVKPVIQVETVFTAALSRQVASGWKPSLASPERLR